MCLDCTKVFAAAVFVTDVIVRQSLKRHWERVRIWERDVVKGWCKNSENASAFLLRANCFLQKEVVNGMSVVQIVMADGISSNVIQRKPVFTPIQEHKAEWIEENEEEFDLMTAYNEEESDLMMAYSHSPRDNDDDENEIYLFLKSEGLSKIAKKICKYFGIESMKDFMHLTDDAFDSRHLTLMPWQKQKLISLGMRCKTQKGSSLPIVRVRFGADAIEGSHTYSENGLSEAETASMDSESDSENEVNYDFGSIDKQFACCLPSLLEHTPKVVHEKHVKITNDIAVFHFGLVGERAFSPKLIGLGFKVILFSEIESLMSKTPVFYSQRMKQQLREWFFVQIVAPSIELYLNGYVLDKIDEWTITNKAMTLQSKCEGLFADQDKFRNQFLATVYKKYIVALEKLKSIATKWIQAEPILLRVLNKEDSVLISCRLCGHDEK